MQPHRTRDVAANIDGNVEPCALGLAITQQVLAHVRMLLVARLQAIGRLHLSRLVWGPTLGRFALLPVTIRSLSLLLIAITRRSCSLLLLLVLTGTRGLVLGPVPFR